MNWSKSYTSNSRQSSFGGFLKVVAHKGRAYARPGHTGRVFLSVALCRFWYMGLSRMAYDYYLFQDESGEPAKGPFFIIGILITTLDGVQCIRRKARIVRKECGFVNEFHWEKFSRKRANAYRRFLRTVWDCPWRYEAIVVQNDGFDLSYFKRPEEDKEIGRFRAYNRFTRMLLENRLEHFPGRTIMIADDKDRMKVDNFVHYIPREVTDQALLRRLPARLERVVPRNSKQVPGLQLVDLITGVIATNRRRGRRPPQTPKELLAAEIMAMDGFWRHVGIWPWQPW